MAIQRMDALFGDILPVRKVGQKGAWFAPWIDANSITFRRITDESTV